MRAKMQGSERMRHELVKRAQQGDHEAFGVLVHGAIARLYASARLILHDADRADDAVQDALVEAWRDIRGLRVGPMHDPRFQQTVTVLDDGRAVIIGGATRSVDRTDPEPAAVEVFDIRGLRDSDPDGGA